MQNHLDTARSRRPTLALAVLVWGVLMSGLGSAPRTEAGWLSATRAPGDAAADAFGIRFNGGFSPYPVMTTSVMPGELVHLEATGGPDGAAVTAGADRGRLEPVSAAAWAWRAPSDPGLARITVHNSSTGETRTLQVFVLVPYDGSPVLNGFRIGRYEPEPLDGDPAYERPRGFIEVTPHNEDIRVSPHFRLKQFLCKQEGGYPKYLVLQPRLLLKLERLHEDLTRARGDEPVIHVMSAFRTPHYNRSIGNRTSYSRHLYGDAADVYIDDDGDEIMDDLTGDGHSSVEDAAVLFAQFEWMHPVWSPAGSRGGLGLYGPAKHRGPFVHVDTRGSHARWGDRKGRAWLVNRGVIGNRTGTARTRPAASASGADD